MVGEVLFHQLYEAMGSKSVAFADAAGVLVRLEREMVVTVTDAMVTTCAGGQGELLLLLLETARRVDR